MYSDFYKWSFIQRFEHTNNARADQRFNDLTRDPLFTINKDQSAQYNLLKKSGVNWKKPNPKTILSAHGLDFLYKFGYDYASRHTHPMSDDGEYEFYKITGSEPNPYDALENNYAVRNSIMISMLILHEVLIIHEFKFRSFLYDYVEQELNNFEIPNNEVDKYFIMILSAVKEGIPLFKK